MRLTPVENDAVPCTFQPVAEEHTGTHQRPGQQLPAERADAVQQPPFQAAFSSFLPFGERVGLGTAGKVHLGTEDRKC